MATDSIHQQEGMHCYDNYFDIMLIGKTGLGKTTTAYKLLMANPTEKIYSYQPSPHDDSPSEDSTFNFDLSARTERNSPSPISRNEDLTMWHISDEPSDIRTMKRILKNLTFCRTLENPHDELHNILQKTEATKFCELISNDTSKVRVLDVPGFFGSECESFSKDVLHLAENAGRRNLQIMRKILHIKQIYNFKFDRIIYFLPETGVLERHSQILRMEIQTMETYFGESIFKCMVVAATHKKSSYRLFLPGVELYSPKDFDSTRFHFLKAMTKVFDQKDIPATPPMAFLSYRETCDGMLEVIKQAKVVKEGVELSFNSSTCARCDIKLKTVRDTLENKETVATEDKRVIVCIDSKLNVIPYDETTCHPMMIPKYSNFERFMGGIAHLITLYRFEGMWPNFKSFEDVCIACGSDPGTRGCKRVRKQYRKLCKQCQGCRNCLRCSACQKREERTDCDSCKVCDRCQSCSGCEEGIPVDHTDKVQENYTIATQDRDVAVPMDQEPCN